MNSREDTIKMKFVRLALVRLNVLSYEDVK